MDLPPIGHVIVARPPGRCGWRLPTARGEVCRAHWPARRSTVAAAAGPAASWTGLAVRRSPRWVTQSPWAPLRTARSRATPGAIAWRCSKRRCAEARCARVKLGEGRFGIGAPRVGAPTAVPTPHAVPVQFPADRADARIGQPGGYSYDRPRSGRAERGGRGGREPPKPLPVIDCSESHHC